MPFFLQPFAKYADFTGRARRAEYWWFFITQIVAYTLIFAFSVTGGSLESSPSILLVCGGLFACACFPPSLAVTVRRLHDSGRSAFWLLLYLPTTLSSLLAVNETITNHGIPSENPMFSGLGSIASLALLVLMCLPGTTGPNRFGNDPKGGSMDMPRIFDTSETEPALEQNNDNPHKPIFDFGPTAKSQNVTATERDLPDMPMAQSAAPALDPMRSATGFSAPARPVFGKRGR